MLLTKEMIDSGVNGTFIKIYCDKSIALDVAFDINTTFERLWNEKVKKAAEERMINLTSQECLDNLNPIYHEEAEDGVTLTPLTVFIKFDHGRIIVDQYGADALIEAVKEICGKYKIVKYEGVIQESATVLEQLFNLDDHHYEEREFSSYRTEDEMKDVAYDFVRDSLIDWIDDKNFWSSLKDKEKALNICKKYFKGITIQDQYS